MRQVELDRRAQPRRVGRVVFQMVPGIGVNEDVQAVPMAFEPGHEGVELGGIERELAAPVRVGTDELLVHAAHPHAEPVGSGLAQGARGLGRAHIEIHVSMISGVDIDRKSVV